MTVQALLIALFRGLVTLLGRLIVCVLETGARLMPLARQVPALLLRMVRQVPALVRSTPRVLLQLVQLLRVVFLNLNRAVQLAILVEPPAAIIYGLATGQPFSTILLWALVLPLGLLCVLSALPLLTIIGLSVLVGLVLKPSPKPQPPIHITAEGAAELTPQPQDGTQGSQSDPAVPVADAKATPPPLKLSLHDFLVKESQDLWCGGVAMDVAKMLLEVQGTGDAPNLSAMPSGLSISLESESISEVSLDRIAYAQVVKAIDELHKLFDATYDRIHQLTQRQELLYELEPIMADGLAAQALTEEDREKWNTFVQSCTDCWGYAFRGYDLDSTTRAIRGNTIRNYGFDYTTFDDEFFTLTKALIRLKSRAVQGKLKRLDLDVLVYAQKRYETVSTAVDYYHVLIDAVLASFTRANLLTEEAFARCAPPDPVRQFEQEMERIYRVAGAPPMASGVAPVSDRYKPLMKRGPALPHQVSAHLSFYTWPESPESGPPPWAEVAQPSDGYRLHKFDR